MKKRLFALVLTLALLLTAAFAEPAESPTPPEGPIIRDAGLDLLGSSVRYPQVSGLKDEDVLKAVNAAILEAGAIEQRLDRMASLLSSPTKLTVSYRYALMGEVLSCAFLAQGPVETARPTQIWTTCTIDLRTGETLPLDALFADADAARAHIESLLTETVAPDLSAHLSGGALTPLPDAYSLADTGLTLYYPIEQYQTLSSRAGTITLRWYELDGHLAPWLRDLVAPGDTTRDALAALLADGSLPGIPAALGEPMQPLVEAHALLTDPDLYESGRMIALETDVFRQAWVLTDALTEDFAQSIVQGVRADRMQLGSIATGQTTMTQWRTLLGDPDATMTVDASRADGWRIVPGTSDYYVFGDVRLRLHADEAGMLRSVFITQ